MTDHASRTSANGGEEPKRSLYGEVRVRCSLRLLETETSPKWRYEQALCASLLEPTFEIKADARAGYVGQYKSGIRTLKNMQDNVLWAAGVAERAHALLTWAHPKKTALFCVGLVCGIVGCSLIPNKLLVAALLSKMFVKGLAVKLKGAKDISKLKKRPDDEVQLDNFLASLPTMPQAEVAQRHKRLVWTAQHAREVNRMRVALNHAFRTRCVGKCLVLGPNPESMEGVMGLTGDDAWHPACFAVVNGLVVTWDSLEAAAANKKPTRLLTIAGPAHPAEHPRAPPPRGRKVVSIATRVGASEKIRDFELALKIDLVDAFSRAVTAELLETQSK